MQGTTDYTMTTSSLRRTAPRRQTSPYAQEVTPGLVERPVTYALDILPAMLGNRVRPLYDSFGQPVVKKVDSTLFALSRKGSRLVGGARHHIFKVQSTDDVTGMSKPGLVTRALTGMENVVDRLLPPPPKRFEGNTEELEISEVTASAVYEDEISTLQRVLNLLSTIRTRLYIQYEVKLILAKVRYNVFCDYHVRPPIRALKNKALAIQSYGVQTVTSVHDTVNAGIVKVETFATARAVEVRNMGERSYTVVVSKTRAANDYVTTKAIQTKVCVTTKLAPITTKTQELLKPLTDRLNTYLLYLASLERRMVAAAFERKAAIGNRVKTTMEFTEKYAAEKYSHLRAVVTKYFDETVAFGQRSLDKILGAPRASWVKGEVAQYASRLSAYSARMA